MLTFSHLLSIYMGVAAAKTFARPEQLLFLCGFMPN